MSSSSSPHIFRQISYLEIVTATDNFADSSMIGKSDFGNVYVGNISFEESQVVVAIIPLKPSSIKRQEFFIQEVITLSKLYHRNIESLIGYCIHEDDKILVYERASYGTLDDHLHKHHTPISWLNRLHILIGVVRGLCYLHYDTEFESEFDTGVIHGRITSEHVLLHENLVPKLSNFGLSKTLSVDPESPEAKYFYFDFNTAYLDPCYVNTRRMGKLQDMYSIGVLMLELLSRKRVRSRTPQPVFGDSVHIVQWAERFIKQKKLDYLADSDILHEISPNCLEKFVSIATKCLQKHPDQRPTINEVVANLEDVLTLQEKFNAGPTPSSRSRSRSRRFGCF